MCFQNKTTLEISEAIEKVECKGIATLIGNTEVTAINKIYTPPVDMLAFNTAAAKLARVIMKKVQSNTANFQILS